MSEEELEIASQSFNFSVPSIESSEGYVKLLQDAGFSSVKPWDMGDHFLRWSQLWLKDTQGRREDLTAKCGEDYYLATVDGIAFWARMAEEKKATWGMFTAQKG